LAGGALNSRHELGESPFGGDSPSSKYPLGVIYWVQNNVSADAEIGVGDKGLAAH